MYVKCTERGFRNLCLISLWMGVNEEWVIVREAALKAFLEGYNLFFTTCWLYPGYLCVFLPW